MVLHSSQNGSKDAATGIKMTKNDMTKAQITEAIKMGIEWIKNHKTGNRNFLFEYYSPKILLKIE